MFPLLEDLKASILQLTRGLVALINQKSDKTEQSVVVVDAYATLAGDDTVSYDLETLLGADHARFNKKGADIQVRAKDTNSSSPLFNAYCNSEGAIVYGLVDERHVRVSNRLGEEQQIHVLITVRPNA